LRECLDRHPFLALLGPSGCGKTSLILTRLVPLSDGQTQPRWVRMMPGSDPLDLLELILQQRPDLDLLVVDQFEELFTLCGNQVQREGFLRRLLELTDQMRVIVAMRADFWGECAAYPEFKQQMLAHQELIGPMQSGELRSAVEQQARKVGLRFE